MMIRVVFEEEVSYVASEPYLRKIIFMMGFDVANTLAS
jgi:hypothetical protein